jgi:hypothetical protein
MFAGHDVALPIDRNIFNFAFIAVVSGEDRFANARPPGRT